MVVSCECAGLLFLDICAGIGLLLMIYVAWLKYQQLVVEGKL
ncbi:MAG: hypothetical protein ACTSQE_14675 [Candidatus Heimdallarchaeaceae archaeon]